MTQSERHAHSQSFDSLRRQIDADPDRRARVEEHKTARLAELRRSLDLTQAALAERLEVTQENVSQIGRGEVDVRLPTSEPLRRSAWRTAGSPGHLPRADR